MRINHIDTEQWTRAMELLDLVLQQPHEKRETFLNEVCSDPDLRAEVEAMLHASGNPIDFLDQGAEAARRSFLVATTVGWHAPRRGTSWWPASRRWRVAAPWRCRAASARRGNTL